MFQYAVARNLAEIHKTTLKLDIFEFEYYKDRAYSLSPFNIKENFATLDEVNRFGMRHKGIWKKAINKAKRKFNISKSGYIKEHNKGFNSEILTLCDGQYLDGFWQSEKYFVNIESIIKSEFKIKKKPEGKNSFIFQQIESCNSIGIHFRRGDYVEKPSTYIQFGLCDMKYYQKAIDMFIETVNKPHFFIFSDDYQWVKDNFRVKAPSTIISHNHEASISYEDLRLMSHCKHNIIANSSFSWWAAWLNSNKSKTVVAPKPWFNEEKNETNYIPSSWIQFPKNCTF